MTHVEASEFYLTITALQLIAESSGKELIQAEGHYPEDHRNTGQVYMRAWSYLRNGSRVVLASVNYPDSPNPLYTVWEAEISLFSAALHGSHPWQKA